MMNISSITSPTLAEVCNPFHTNNKKLFYTFKKDNDRKDT